MGKDPIIDIHPGFKDAFTVQDLLRSEGSLYIKIGNTSTLDDGFIFNILINDFVFFLSFKNNAIVSRRNNAICALPLDDVLGRKEDIIFSIIWTHDKLGLHYTVGDSTNEIEIPITSTVPPAKLIMWARINSLIPTETYNTEEEFRERIHSCLNTINTKIRKADAYMSFWNVIRDGNKIIDRKPKYEVEIQPLIQCMLSDLMLINNIEMIPEYKTGVGALDFLFVGNVKNEGMCKFCAEFKRAHSSDLENGLLYQLPRYMDFSDATYGAYCVLNFKGEWFEQPVFDKEENLKEHLDKIHYEVRKPVHRNIKVFIFDFGKPITASRKPKQ